MNNRANNLILNRLFTHNVFQNLIHQYNDDTYNAIVNRYIKNPINKKNIDIINELYLFMSYEYRNEYFYQNTLLNKLLLGKHSIKTTTALTQLYIGKSIADFILINGKAVVYEIKTELDSLERLDTQIFDYFKAFNHVCIVTSDCHYKKIAEKYSGTPVGIYVLTPNNTISAILKKEPTPNNEYLKHDAIFKVLRKKEFESILMSYFKILPTASQVYYYSECLSMFSSIPIFEAYTLAISELKKRKRVIANELNKVPYELKSLVYFSSQSTCYLEKLIKFLDINYGG